MKPRTAKPKRVFRPKYTDDELRRGASIVTYEINMLRHTLDLCGTTEAPAHTAVSECNLIHARALLDFLFSPGRKEKKDDDIIALDYVRDADRGGYTRAFRGRSQDLRHLTTIANKHLAHITAARPPLGRRVTWNPLARTKEIAGLLVTFETFADRSRMPHRLRNAIARLPR